MGTLHHDLDLLLFNSPCTLYTIANDNGGLKA